MWFIRRLMPLSFFLGAVLTGWPQPERQEQALLQTLDSIQQTPSLAGHFAGIYFETTVNAISFFSLADSQTRSLMQRMEIRFADLFLHAANAYKNKQAIPAAWAAYYADTSNAGLRHILLGINSHINGDIWQALTLEFSPEELVRLRPYYKSYYQGLLQIYDQFYNSALADNKKLRLLHMASFGLDRCYGKILLSRWRKRQWQMAVLYFNNPVLFKKKKEKLNRKMDRLNRLISKNI